MQIYELQPGDKVAVRYSHGFDTNLYRSGTVDRITKTRVIVDGFSYSRLNGYAIGGGGYHKDRIDPLTDETQRAIDDTKCKLQHRHLRRKIEDKLSELPLETLTAIAAVIWPVKTITESEAAE